MISETQVFSPSLVNEVRFAYSRVAASVLQEDFGTSINHQVGLPELSSNPRDFGLSFITITGFSPLGDEFNNPQNSVTNMFQVLDGASYARGRHLAKFGFEFRAVRQNAFRDVQSRGFLTFSSQIPLTGNASVAAGFVFDTYHSVRVDMPAEYFWGLTPAYNLAANGATIQAWAVARPNRGS